MLDLTSTAVAASSEFLRRPAPARVAQEVARPSPQPASVSPLGRRLHKQMPMSGNKALDIILLVLGVGGGGYGLFQFFRDMVQSHNKTATEKERIAAGGSRDTTQANTDLTKVVATVLREAIELEKQDRAAALAAQATQYREMLDQTNRMTERTASSVERGMERVALAIQEMSTREEQRYLLTLAELERIKDQLAKNHAGA